jgi:O-6-methylguanine DNA methyltransferase
MATRKEPARAGYALFDTAIGTCGIAWTEHGIVRIQLPERSRAATIVRLATGRALDEQQPPRAVARAIARITRHVGGDPQDLSDLALDMRDLAPFRRQVYEAARRIGAGTTATYGDVARALAMPGAARAIGRTLGTNPLPIVVPCHRVIAANGRSGGFSAFGGLATKERLLAAEGVTGGWRPAAGATRTVAMPASAKANGAAATAARPAARRASPAGSQTDAATAAAGGASRRSRLRTGVAPTIGDGFDDAAALRHLRAVDARLGAWLDEFGPFTMQCKETGSTFAALAEAIVYQQLHGKAAATIFGRFQALYPGKRFPQPESVLATPDETLRAAGLSRNKLLAIRDLAERCRAGSVPALAALRRMPDDEVIQCLTAVRGIGRWTAEMLLLFRLGRPDVLPVDDYGVRKGFAVVFHRKELPAPAELARHGERWRPYRSVASWYLWRAADRALRAPVNA